MPTISRFFLLVCVMILSCGCSQTVPGEVSSTDLPLVKLTPSSIASLPYATAQPTIAPDDTQAAPPLSDRIPTDGLILVAHVSREGTCYDIGVYQDDHYTIHSCLPDFTYPSTEGSLKSHESAYLRRWEERFQSFEESSDQSLLKFLGTGGVIPEYADKASMRALLGDIEWRAHGYIHRGGSPSAVLVAQRVLSNRIGIPLDHQNVLKFDVVDFPDTCLGAPRPDEVCAPVFTQGFHIQFVAQGMLYEYRTDVFGYDIRPFGEPQIAPTQGPAG